MEFVNDENDDERPEIDPDKFVEERKRKMRRSAWWSIVGGAAVTIFTVGGALYILNSPELVEKFELRDDSLFSVLSRNILFLLGLFFLGGGIWGLYEAKRLTFDDLITSPEAIEFIESGANVSHLYSYIILGSLIAVSVAQLAAGTDRDGELISIQLAGLNSERVIGYGEYWRILTSGLMHYWFIHLYFNAQAFYGLGGLTEFVSDRSRMAIVFVAAMIGGAIASLIFLPGVNSVGASGGIMGLIGYLTIYGYRRKTQLPPGFLRSMIVNFVFIAAIGIVGYKVINNFAHFGGFLIGLVYAFFTVPKDRSVDPRRIGAITEGTGMVAVGTVVFFAVFTILILTGRIAF